MICELNVRVDELGGELTRVQLDVQAERAQREKLDIELTTKLGKTFITLLYYYFYQTFVI